MKGEEALYSFNIRKAKMFPKRERITKALGFLKKQVFKHSRDKNPTLATEVNEFLHAHSKNVPEKINVVLRKKDDNVTVFLQGGKQLELVKKKEAEEKKKKAEKKEKDEKEKSKKDKGEEKSESKMTEEEKLAEAEKERKLADKREKEQAGAALEVKRKTGRK